MPSIALLLALAAAPAWTVTFETSQGTDVGNGKISATADTQTRITPTQILRSKSAMNKGKASGSVLKPQPLSAELRDAIVALLPKLPAGNASYSSSPTVDDEGWNSSTLVITREGKTVSFQLLQGGQVPLPPPEVKELLSLVAKAQRATE